MDATSGSHGMSRTGSFAASDGPGAGRPAVGRPRRPEVDDAVTRAVLELLAERGYRGLTMDAVARRSGVAKTTIYRRFTGKLDLLRAAIERLASERFGEPDTGSLRGDLEETVRMMARATAPPWGAVVAAVVGEAPHDPELREAAATFVARWRTVFRRMLWRAVERAELPADTDLDLLIDMLVGPLYYRLLVTGRPVVPELAEPLTTTLLEGLAPSRRSRV